MQTSKNTQTLLAGATVCNGVIAGSSIDRALVQLPAFEDLGTSDWARFSRHADLKRGLAIYPLAAIGGAVFSAAAAVKVCFQENTSKPARVAACAAVALSLGGLLATAKAAPNMLSLKKCEDKAAVSEAFDGFQRWHRVRALFQGSAFIANVLAISTEAAGVSRETSQPR